jgi:hypothetical protein
MGPLLDLCNKAQRSRARCSLGPSEPSF